MLESIPKLSNTLGMGKPRQVYMSVIGRRSMYHANRSVSRYVVVCVSVCMCVGVDVCACVRPRR